jgi:hypothetical protein
MSKPSILPVEKRLAPSIKSAIRFAEEAVILSLLIDFWVIAGVTMVASTDYRSAGAILLARKDAGDTVRGQARHRVSLMCGR